jgi:hypothetical protein
VQTARQYRLSIRFSWLREQQRRHRKDLRHYSGGLSSIGLFNYRDLIHDLSSVTFLNQLKGIRSLQNWFAGIDLPDAKRHQRRVPINAQGRSVITELEQQTGVETRRIHVDKGYRGHNHPEKFRVWISGQLRRVTKPIRREMRRRAAVEPVIGHTKPEHRMGRNYLKGRDGDRINAVLAAAGYNFSLLLRWLARLLRALLQALFTARPDAQQA